jgi:hypothetical protein
MGEPFQDARVEIRSIRVNKKIKSRRLVRAED